MSESEKDTAVPVEPHVVGGLFDNQISKTIDEFKAMIAVVNQKLDAILAKLK